MPGFVFSRLTFAGQNTEADRIIPGMPYPQNLETAQEVEAVVRATGAEPATIAVLDGVPHVGLTQMELKHLAQLGHSVVRVSIAPSLVCRFTKIHKRIQTVCHSNG